VQSNEAKIQTFGEAAAAERFFQVVERPIGVIFGFGAMMGLIVGLVIVYQVLSTDVADHLREYATFKAMGYRDRFFLGIILEEAVILAICGFIPGSLVSMVIYKALAGATGLPLEMSSARLASVFVGTLLACILSGALATRRLAAADPAELF
jgi:putative ABC transport system permease protein